jgi:gas vesicle protein
VTLLDTHPRDAWLFGGAEWQGPEAERRNNLQSAFPGDRTAALPFGLVPFSIGEEMALILLLCGNEVEVGCCRRHDENRGGSMNESTTYSTKMLCFLAGGLAGASVALLLAPQSGKATREAMRQKARDTADSVRGLKDRAVRRGEEVRDETVRRVGAAASALAGNGAETEPDKAAAA